MRVLRNTAKLKQSEHVKEGDVLSFLIGLARMAATTLATAAATKLAKDLTEADTDLSNEEIQKRWQQFLDELHRELEETKTKLEEERQKRKRHIVAVGVLCFILERGRKMITMMPKSGSNLLSRSHVLAAY